MEFFRYEKLSDKVIRIIDFLNNCCYLVIGDERACLIDTLDGFGDLKEYCKQFTNKAIFVILTHGHLDHTGGCYFFDEVFIHEKEKTMFKEMNNVEFRLKRYANDPQTRNVPIKDFNLTYSKELKNIENEMIISLGGISIQTIVVAGHTKGIVVALIKEERMIIFGDACGVGVLLMGENSTTISEYKKSLLHLKKFEDQYDTILRNHGTFSSQKILLDNVITCCDNILQGKTTKNVCYSHGMKFYLAEPIDENGNRIDGKEGNIKYFEENAK